MRLRSSIISSLTKTDHGDVLASWSNLTATRSSIVVFGVTLTLNLANDNQSVWISKISESIMSGMIGCGSRRSGRAVGMMG